ncbi:MAG: L,D-transpeptidase family protein [Alphaproteobacteria bacterium]|nr:L,D-transpeptidase family protein [Alphaproteobacteria bacterium]
MSRATSRKSRAAVRQAPAYPMRQVLLASVAAAAMIAIMPKFADAQHAGAATPNAEVKAPAQEMLGQPSADPVVAAIGRAITANAIENELDGDFGPGVVLAARQAYARKVFQPVWTEAGVAAFRAELKDHFRQGVVIDELDLQDVDRLTFSRFEGEPAARAQADIGLTASFVRLANAVSGGLKDEGGADTAEDDAPNRAVLTNAIVEAGKGAVASAIDELEPDHPQYAALKRALREYRQIKSDGGWLAIPDGGLVRPGDRDPRIPALRNRLEIEGYDTSGRMLLTQSADSPAGGIGGLDQSVIPDGKLASLQNDGAPTDRPDIYDPGLVAALKEFQRRHGLEDDGVLGPNTLSALNESVTSKIDRIVENMHRWRKQGDMGTRYVWANIPSFTAEGWNDGQREISMRTIVGLPSRETPVFSDEIEFVVPNPRWYAPVSIVRRDKLPKLANDPGYANRNNYQVFDRQTEERVNPYHVDWNDPASARKYKLVQMPGDQNALGRIKIMFPTQYSVYMHGTPGKHLFDKAERTFSSGCVRLEDPVGMASWLARYDGRLDAGEIREKVESRERKWMKVGRETPVHITYFTVTVGDDGQINFWRDVYNKGDGIEHVKKFAPLYTPPPASKTPSDGTPASRT